METPTVLVVLAVVVGVAGAVSATAMAARIYRAASTLGDKSLALACAGMIVYAMALLLEVTGNAFAAGSHLGGFGHGRRPEEVAILAVNRGTLASLPLYTVAYALLAASHYVSSVPVGGRLYSGVPVILLIYADYNAVNLVVIAVAAYLSLGKYGKASPGITAFYTSAAASHVLASIPAIGVAFWWAPQASSILRGVAAALMLAHAHLGGRRVG